MVAWKDIEQRHGELKRKRQREEPVWRELARMLRPDGRVLNQNEIRERNAFDDPFDSTPLYALEDFTGGMFTKATNPAERWFELTIRDNEDLAKWAPVAKWLWGFANVIYGSLHPNHDNFYLHAPAWMADMGMSGTGFMWQEEIVGADTIIAKNIPIGEAFKDVDANGVTDTFHREFKLTGRQAKAKFGRRADTSGFRDEDDIIFVHAIYPNPDYKPGNPFWRHMRYRSCYVAESKANFGVEGGYNEFPLHEIEWSQRSGRAWATGPGHNALADMRQNDEVARSTIAAIQFDAEPMWWAADEEVLTTADIVPGNVLYGESVGQGRPPAQIIERAKQMQLPLAMQQDLRNQIRRAFHFGLSQVLANRPQMTAQEVMAYNADELKILAPNLVRTHRGLASFLARRASLLIRRGKVPPPPPELLRAGGAVTPDFVSPFAKAQKAEVAKGVLGWVQTKVALAEQTRDASWTDDIDADGVSAVLHDAMSGVPSIKLDQRAVAQKRATRAQAMAQQAQVEQAAQQASIIADVSHAQQASTLAKGRATQ